MPSIAVIDTLQPATVAEHSRADRLAQALGWFSVGLGIAEIVIPHRITRAIGIRGKNGLVRAYGARELAAAVPTLWVNRRVGMVSRILGDALDIATVLPAARRNGPKRRNAVMALGALGFVTVLDIVATAGLFSASGRTKRPSDPDGAGGTTPTESKQEEREILRDYPTADRLTEQLPAIPR